MRRNSDGEEENNRKGDIEENSHLLRNLSMLIKQACEEEGDNSNVQNA